MCDDPYFIVKVLENIKQVLIKLIKAILILELSIKSW